VKFASTSAAPIVEARHLSTGKHLQTPHDSLDDPKIAKQPVKLWKKVVPLAIIFFISSFNLTILQALKDAIVVTTSGAEALPYLASFVVLPASLAFFAYYSKMLSVMPKHRVYYLAILPFVVFYAIFASAVYPMADSLHFHGLFNRVPHLLNLLNLHAWKCRWALNRCVGVSTWMITCALGAHTACMWACTELLWQRRVS
jgi:ATP/ADP translocase